MQDSARQVVYIAIFVGYWGDDAKTSEVISRDGWMATGDLASMDDEVSVLPT